MRSAVSDPRSPFAFSDSYRAARSAWAQFGFFARWRLLGRPEMVAAGKRIIFDSDEGVHFLEKRDAHD